MPNEKRLRIHPEIRQRARELRQPQTPDEARLWQVLRNRQLGGFKFRRQHPIGPYIVDFYCAEAKLVVEIDGPIHDQQKEDDEVRMEWLEYNGYRVIRFTNERVRNELGEVTRQILVVCRN